MEDEEMKFGPNGGLVFSMEFLLENTEWLQVTFKKQSSLFPKHSCMIDSL